MDKTEKNLFQDSLISEECKKQFTKGGFEYGFQYLNKMLNLEDLMNVPLNIGIIGSSGVGKSSFINSIRGLTGDDEGSAAVGVTETTMTPTPYEHPNNSNLKFWDLPGVGTSKYPKESYLEKIHFNNYDFFLVLTANRFTETDAWLAKHIIDRHKPLYFVRTQISIDIERDKRGHPRTHNAATVVENLRQSLKEHMKSENFKTRLYLIDSYERQHFDFGDLESDIIQNYPEEKRQALIMSLGVFTQDVIKSKVSLFTKRIYIAAVLSAAGAVVSDMGLKIDLVVLKKEAELYFKQLGLSKNALQLAARLLSIKEDCLISIVSQEFPQAVDFDSSEQQKTIRVIEDLVTSIINEKSKLTSIVVLEEVNRFIPFLFTNTITTIGVSFQVSYELLHQLLDKFRNIALQIVKVYNGDAICLEAEKQNLMNELNNVEIQLNEMKCKKEENEAEIHRVDAQIKQLNEEIDRLEQELEVLHEEQARLKEQLHKLQEEHDILQDKLEQKTQRLHDLQEKLVELEEKRQELEEKCAQLEQNKQQIKQEIQQIESQIAQLEQQLQKLKNHLQQLAQEIRSLEAEIDRNNDEITDMQNQIVALEQRQEQTQNRIQDNEMKCDANEAEQKKIEDMKQRLTHLIKRNHIQEQNSEKQKLETNLDFLNKTVPQLERELVDQDQKRFLRAVQNHKNMLYEKQRTLATLEAEANGKNVELVSKQAQKLAHQVQFQMVEGQLLATKQNAQTNLDFLNKTFQNQDQDQKLWETQRSMQKLESEHSKLESNLAELAREKQQAECEIKKFFQHIRNHRNVLYEKQRAHAALEAEANGKNVGLVSKQAQKAACQVQLQMVEGQLLATKQEIKNVKRQITDTERQIVKQTALVQETKHLFDQAESKLRNIQGDPARCSKQVNDKQKMCDKKKFDANKLNNEVQQRQSSLKTVDAQLKELRNKSFSHRTKVARLTRNIASQPAAMLQTRQTIGVTNTVNSQNRYDQNEEEEDALVANVQQYNQ